MNFDTVMNIVIKIIVLAASAYVIPYLNGKIGEQKAKKIEDAVRRIVHAVEQNYKGIEHAGAEKKAEVIKQLVNDGIIKSVTAVTKYVDDLIESTVYEMNK